MVLFDLFIKKTNDTRLQFFRYIGAGGFAAILNIGSLFLFKTVFGIYYLIANIFSFSIGLIANYILSKIFVFSAPINMTKFFEILILGLISIIGLGLDTLFLWSFTHILGVHYLISKILSTGLVFGWNFSSRKTFYRLNSKEKNTVLRGEEAE